jgi:hypothetical protein
MALADVLVSRWSRPAARLPGRLEDLHGPGEGVVVLPVHLTWHGLREFDVTDSRLRLCLYRNVLSQGQRNDVARFLNARLLAGDWPQLCGLLARRTRRACERRFGLAAASIHTERERRGGTPG